MDVYHDLRYAFRRLRRSPGFASTAIAILILGIGVNTAIFSVVYAVILRPLPYPEAPKLVFVWQHFRGVPPPFSEHMFVARQNYREWQRQNTVFQEMAAFHTTPVDEPGGDDGNIFATFASASLFHLLGVQPQIGRLFRHEEESEGHDRVAILSDEYFERRFHRDPGALGKIVVFDNIAYTVIGVLPRSFY
ncbi:MAG TPA: ABC transporter permease, partial [Bryobacteraceae bacterium]